MTLVPIVLALLLTDQAPPGRADNGPFEMNNICVSASCWPDQNELPAEPILFVTAPGSQTLELIPTRPKPVVGVFLIACRTGSFVCSDNGAEFHLCARWELLDLGLQNPRYQNGHCIADRK